MKYVPYTYLIGWTKTNMWYYGSETGWKTKTANPTNLWKTYFTSSEYVLKYRLEHGEPDVIEIRKSFHSDEVSEESNALLYEKCSEWEQKTLKRMKVLDKPDQWLNKNIGGVIGSHVVCNPYWNNGKRNLRRSTSPGPDWTRGMLVTEESHLKRSKATKGRTGIKNSFYGKTHSKETKEFIGKKNSGENNHWYGKERKEHSETMKDRIRLFKDGRYTLIEKDKLEEMQGDGWIIFTSDTTKEKISKSHNVTYTCPHCNKSGGRLLLRWHFNHCRFKNSSSLDDFL